MPIPITIPRLGWNMEQGTFVEWLKADGDPVKPGDMLYRLEGEKSVEEIEAFDAGVLFIPPDGPQPGSTVNVGAVVGQLLQPGEAKPKAGGSAEVQPIKAAPVQKEAAASPSVRRLAREKGIDLAAVAGSGPGGRITEGDLDQSQWEKVFDSIADDRNLEPATTTTAISPRARRFAKQHNIDFTQLRGSGKSGRIRECDVTALLAGRASDGASPSLARPANTNPMRKAIAARMLASQQATAQVTLTSLVDASNLVGIRDGHGFHHQSPLPVDRHQIGQVVLLLRVLRGDAAHGVEQPLE